MEKFTKSLITLLIVVSMLVIGVTLAFANVDNYDSNRYSGSNPPILQIKDGLIRGYVQDGIFAFLGVQYAVAERFEMPRPVEPWEGVKNAQVYGFISPIPQQTAVGRDEFVWPHRFWIENESCQVLNVWTPIIERGAKKPVMVFIHGGGFTNGSSIEAYAYEGKNLAAFGDVVVVTLNHRLNVLGCLDLSAYGEEYKYSGNLGMADLVAALEWVQENIDYFGGDPDNVFIFGQSGGSTKVTSLMHMPVAEGLFHKAAGHSSGGVNFNDQETTRLVARYTLENLGLDANSVDEIRTVPYRDLIEAGTAANRRVSEELGRAVSWRSVADNDYHMSVYQDFAHDIPFILGTVFSENFGTLHYDGPVHKKDWTDELTMTRLAERFPAENVDEIIREFNRLYPLKETRDAYFYDPARRLAMPGNAALKAENARAPVYKFMFAYEAPVNGGLTAFHCAELSYIFHNVSEPMVRLATGDARESFYMQDVMARAWVNFVYTGDPSQNGLEWRPYSETGETMVFDLNSACYVLDDVNMNNLMLAR